MKKICFISPHLYNLILNNKDGFGGAEVDIYNLAKNLANENFLVSIVCITPKLKKPKKINGIMIYPVMPYSSERLRRGEFFYYIISLFKVLKKQDADIYLGTLASLESIVVFLVSFLKRKKFAFRIEHDWETDYYGLKNKIFIGESFIDKILPYFFVFSLKFSKYIFVSKDNQKIGLISNFKIKTKKIIRISNIVENFSDFKKNQQVVLWVNRAHPMKKPEIFLKICNLFPNERFVMICPLCENNQSFFDHLKEKAEKIKNLKFIPGVPKNDMIKYYQIAKFFILTSECEGQSNVLIESLKSKSPVVSLFMDPNNILMDNKIGFCADGNFDKMKNFIKLILSNKKMLDEYSDNAYNFAKKNFDNKKIVEQYKKIFYENYN